MADDVTRESTEGTQPEPGAPTQGAPATPAPQGTRDPDIIAAVRKEADDLRAKLAVETAQRTKLEEERQTTERKRLEEEGKWKELAEQETRRAKEVESSMLKEKQEIAESIKIAELKARLALEGAEDLDYYLLADRSKLTFDGGKVGGLDEVIGDLKQRKPHIFTRKAVAATTSNAGAPPASAPTATTQNASIKDVTQIKDPKEYENYKRSMLRSLRGGRRA